MDIVKNLQDAKARIQKGWTKFTRENCYHEFCALGAVREDPWAIKDKWPEIKYLADTIPLEKKQPRFSLESMVGNYNNQSETTHADMLAWFDRAIALAKKERGDVEQEVLKIEDFMDGGKFGKKWDEAQERKPVLQDA